MNNAKDTESSKSAPTFQGEVVYLFAYDIAYEMDRQAVTSVLGHQATEYSLVPSHRTPRNGLFVRSSRICFPAEKREGPRGTVEFRVTVKVLPIGAISISVRVPFAVTRLEELQCFHDARFGQDPLSVEMRVLAERIRTELAPNILRPGNPVSDEEAYTVFCFHGPMAGQEGHLLRAEAWMETHRREVAALLVQETGGFRLSRQETMESTEQWLSYYMDDLVVMDWDSALIIDAPGELEETLHVLELANLQLVELEAYDRVLDATLERSYRDVREPRMFGHGDRLKELRELRVDFARFSDELSNITKVFGDWHLARVYQMVARRFHLKEWQGTVDAKMRTMGDLHELLKSDHSNRWMMILEVTIVLLFIIDVVMLFQGGKK